jgi:hypothetical protein
VDTEIWDADYSAISIAPGAKNITLASDLIAASNIVAIGVDGLDVTGNTIQHGCDSGISAFGVALDWQANDYGSSPGGLTVTINWGDGTTSTVGSARSNTNDHTYAKLGTYTITVTANDNEGDIASNSVTGETGGSEFTAYGPARILDTRKGIGTGKVTF